MTNIQTLAAALRTRKLSSRELVEESLRKIEHLDAELNAFITVLANQARKRAAALDAALARGVDYGPLHGIPIAHKDLVRTAGIRTTAGSKIFSDYIPKRDALIERKLHAAGAVLIGKTGLHELAFGITSNNPHFGAIHNPWDVERIPGGSSGGSAVAVSAGMVTMATGTDTGGSIRVPASFSGVVGLKPTFGHVSYSGILPLSFSQDHAGPLAGTVRDAAITYQAMLEPDAWGGPSGYVPPAGVEIRGVRIGLPTNFYYDRLDIETGLAVRKAIQTAAAIGAKIVEIEVPDMVALNEAGALILKVEAASCLRPHLDRRGDFGADVLALLDSGKQIPGIDYIDALRTRKRSGREFAKLWDQVDCIFTPATPMPAPKIGQSLLELGGREEEVRAAATRFTRGMNVLGLPAISIPCGFTKSGLPIGLQIIGASRQEDLILRVAAAMEDATGISHRRPEIAS